MLTVRYNTMQTITDVRLRARLMKQFNVNVNANEIFI